ncbi:hypothetical protein ACKVV1_011560 [Pyricularia oryzae]
MLSALWDFFSSAVPLRYLPTKDQPVLPDHQPLRAQGRSDLQQPTSGLPLSAP